MQTLTSNHEPQTVLHTLTFRVWVFTQDIVAVSKLTIQINHTNTPLVPVIIMRLLSPHDPSSTILGQQGIHNLESPAHKAYISGCLNKLRDWRPRQPIYSQLLRLRIDRTSRFKRSHPHISLRVPPSRDIDKPYVGTQRRAQPKTLNPRPNPKP